MSDFIDIKRIGPFQSKGVIRVSKKGSGIQKRDMTVDKSVISVTQQRGKNEKERVLF